MNALPLFFLRTSVTSCNLKIESSLRILSDVPCPYRMSEVKPSRSPSPGPIPSPSASSTLCSVWLKKARDTEFVFLLYGVESYSLHVHKSDYVPHMMYTQV